MSLTDRQQRFCEEYILDLNATQAAIRSGYSAKTANAAASRMMASSEIKTEIDKLKEARSMALGISAADVLGELKIIALANVDDFSIDETGKLVTAPDALPDLSRAVARKRWKRRVVHSADGQPANVFIEEFEIGLHDRSAAIQAIMKHLPSKNLDGLILKLVKELASERDEK